MTPNELVLTFGGLHVCVQFGENRRRNATVSVHRRTHTHTHTHGQTQNDFIMCPMLYAIAMGQIKTKLTIICDLPVIDLPRDWAHARPLQGSRSPREDCASLVDQSLCQQSTKHTQSYLLTQEASIIPRAICYYYQR